MRRLGGLLILVALALPACPGPPVMLRAHWVSGQAVYDTTGQPVLWSRDQLPLRVWVGLDEPQAELVDEVAAAAKLWNRELGFPAFTLASQAVDAQVLVLSGEVRGGDVASTRHHGDGRPEAATVTLRMITCAAEAMWIAVHELGHVLGLADGERGVMAWLPPDLCDSARFPWALPTSAEVELLRRLYR